MKRITMVMLIMLAGGVLLFLAACGSSDGTILIPNPAATTASWADVTVASGSQQVTLSWTDKDNPNDTKSTYTIYWANSPGVTKTSGNKITNVTAPYVHTGLINGAAYYYAVTRVSGGTEGNVSYEVSAQPQASLPAAPAGITITAGNGTVTLAWPAVTSTGTGTGLKYNIYWSTAAGVTKSSGTKIPNVTASQTTSPLTFTHSNLLNDGSTTYYYVITAETTEGESDVSRQVSAKPLQPAAAASYDPGPPVVDSTYGSPTSVNAKPGNQQVTIGWGVPAAPATPNPGTVTRTYNITWWTTDPGDTHTISNLSSNSFTHLSLANGTTYNYRVSAVMTAVDNGTTVTTTGPVSAQVSVVPEAATPAAPAGLSAATGNQEVSLSWSRDKSGSTVTYNVYWSNDPTMAPQNVAKISNITANTFVHSGLKTGTTYYYQVTAQIDGESGFSNRISATP